MNTSRPSDRRPVDDNRPGVAERDWQAQERALSGATADRRDLLLARALRTMPLSRPPADFASAVARIAARDGGEAAAESGLERVLLHVLLAAMALAGAGAVAMYGGRWWALAGEMFGTQATLWAAFAGLCLLLSWLPQAVRRLLDATRTPTPA
ncbi:hypothetical protein FZO89_07540 [Luteimonas viscosa]|uniref:Uncharacterized protein n=1 Tax=Luteimonas viscosa TaxID=1132694 RepID=A0A5D4XPS2_9GAMM|nr:hypothetical protein [Luteimonas viscosa]TYT26124.1 hypothetical protein FZO89_07540 [Luteimonas viscosa]